MRKRRRVLALLLAGLLLATGVLWAGKDAEGAGTEKVNVHPAVQRLAEEIACQDPQILEFQRNLARWYNLNLTSEEPEEGFQEAYSDILCFTNRVMASIEIPSLEISLPIYHGTGEEALSYGVGHMPNSAFPIGEEGDHSVLVGYGAVSGENGLSGLTGLEPGEVFYIHILGETLAYRVEDVLVSVSDGPVDLSPVPGQDLCTLTACSPNDKSYQLVVRGKRTELTDQEALVAPKEETADGNPWSLVAAVIAAVGAATVLHRRRPGCINVEP